jgi:hypothetical protein
MINLYKVEQIQSREGRAVCYNMINLYKVEQIQSREGRANLPLYVESIQGKVNISKIGHMRRIYQVMVKLSWIGPIYSWQEQDGFIQAGENLSQVEEI